MVGRLAPKKYGGRHGPSDLDGKGVQPAVIVSIGPAASPPTTHDSRSAVVPAIAKSGGLNADAEAENRAEKPSGTPFQITRHRLGDVGKGNGRQFPQGAPTSISIAFERRLPIACPAGREALPHAGAIQGLEPEPRPRKGTYDVLELWRGRRRTTT
jgi:hypothetical protein